MPAKILHAELISQAFRSAQLRDNFLAAMLPVMASPRIPPPESTAAVAERLRLTRLAFGMKKATWCRLVGISQPAWAGVEGTKNTPAMNRIALDQALLICRATGVSLDWIYRGNRDGLPMKLALALREVEAQDGATTSQQ